MLLIFLILQDYKFTPMYILLRKNSPHMNIKANIKVKEPGDFRICLLNTKSFQHHLIVALKNCQISLKTALIKSLFSEKLTSVFKTLVELRLCCSFSEFFFNFNGDHFEQVFAMVSVNVAYFITLQGSHKSKFSKIIRKLDI